MRVFYRPKTLIFENLKNAAIALVFASVLVGYFISELYHRLSGHVEEGYILVPVFLSILSAVMFGLGVMRVRTLSNELSTGLLSDETD